MDNKYKTLVVIASHNNFDRLSRLFKNPGKIWNTGVDCDFLIVNNGSNNDYLKSVGSLQPQILFLHRENLGQETGAFHDAEMQYDKYDRYMFLQDDTIILKNNWLKTFQDKFDVTQNCGAVGYEIYDKEHLGEDWRSDTGITIKDYIKEKFGNNFIYNKFCGGAILYTSRFVLDKLRSVGGIPCFKVPRPLGYHLGLASERLFSTYIENLGFEVVENPDVIANGWLSRKTQNREGIPY